MEQEKINSFTIGTAGQGGALKVYFKDIDIELIKKAIMVYNTTIKGDQLRKELR